MHTQIFNSDRGLSGELARHFGAIMAMAGLLLLSACGSSKDVTQHDLTEPGKDGVAPTLTSVSIQPDGYVELDQSVRIDFVASEALMTPLVTINGVQAEVTGSIAEWRAVRRMTAADVVGEVTFSIAFQDISGEAGADVSTTTNGSVAEYCAENCPKNELGPLEGNWKLDLVGVGPAEGDISWWSLAASSGDRACLFDDLYVFGADGSFANVLGDETWLETWQGVAEGCGAPVAPHDGSSNAIFEYDEGAGTLKLTGQGAFLGLAKVVNGGELTDPTLAPESVTYVVAELIENSLTVRVDIGGGWWEFRLTRISNLPVVGNWKLDFVGVGPVEGDTQWWSLAASSGERACLFDDVYHIGGDGSFQNYLGGETWVEGWQGAVEGCGTPVAPHDGSSAGAWTYDGATGALTIDGLGSFLGLAKVVNGAELADPAAAPESVTYSVADIDGDLMTVRVDIGGGWWEFRLTTE